MTGPTAKQIHAERKRREALGLDASQDAVMGALSTPPCAASMGCLCAGHARGNPASAPCDTSEGPPTPKMIEELDVIIGLARDAGRAAVVVARAEHARDLEGRKSRRTYNDLREARGRAAIATEQLNRARARFLARFQ